MSLATNVSNLATRVATEFKTIRTLVTGSGTGTLSGLTTTDKSSVVAAINEVKAGSSGSPSDASETVKGIAEVATTGETTTGTDDGRMITPLKLAQKLTAWAQPLSSNLTTLAGVASGTFGRTLLGSADATAAKTSLGLAAVASSGSASDITTGTLPPSVLPPLAINETTVVADQTAMLALTAQRGDVAIRTDNSRSYILASDSPSTLADWKQITAAGDIVSVAGRTGVVTLAKADVGLSAVDNTADADKPVSTAQATADGLRMLKSSNLSDVADAATARTNLSVYSQSDMGDPTTNFVTTFETGLT
jgi:hypothetical protein